MFKKTWSSFCGSVVTNLTSIHEDLGSIPGVAHWVKDLTLLSDIDAARISCYRGRGLGQQL